MKSQDNQAATKQDVEEIVGRVVGEIVGDALQMISGQFDEQKLTLDEHSATLDKHEAILSRIENKLDPTIELVDNQQIRIAKLEQKTA